jgi:Pentapeptide repeats (8 copies)
VLPKLDGRRKARVVQFLYESGLIAENRPIVAMRAAYLRGADLSRANLSGANLSGEEQLEVAGPLEGTTMHNGQKCEEWIKRREEDG